MVEHPGSWLLDAFHDVGVDVSTLAAKLPSEAAKIQDYPDTIGQDEINRVLIECAAQCADPHFGLHLVQAISPSKLGIYAYLLFNASTIGEFLNLAQRYYPIFYRGAVLDISVGDDFCQVTYKPKVIPFVSQRHDTEWTLGFFVHTIRSLLDGQWWPLRTTFQEGKPDELDVLEEFFGDNLVFCALNNSFDIEIELLDKTLNDSHPQLLKIIMEQADVLLHEFMADDSLEPLVRLLIIKDLEHNSPTSASVARQAGMSLSTFKRRLSSLGLTYRQVRDDVIFQLARRALRETDIKISFLAMQLGFSEVSAFNHAFLRITQQSPSNFRRAGINRA